MSAIRCFAGRRQLADLGEGLPRQKGRRVPLACLAGVILVTGAVPSTALGQVTTQGEGWVLDWCGSGGKPAIGTMQIHLHQQLAMRSEPAPPARSPKVKRAVPTPPAHHHRQPPAAQVPTPPPNPYQQPPAAQVPAPPAHVPTPPPNPYPPSAQVPVAPSNVPAPPPNPSRVVPTPQPNPYQVPTQVPIPPPNPYRQFACVPDDGSNICIFDYASPVRPGTTCHCGPSSGTTQ
jgi:hypothetical protein